VNGQEAQVRCTIVAQSAGALEHPFTGSRVQPFTLSKK